VNGSVADDSSVATALRHGATHLASAGIDNPALDARLLLAHAMGLDQAALLRDRAAPVPASYQALLARRAAREPIAFILGRQGFWTLDFEVSQDTLIPRADSETLIEAVLAARPNRASVGRVLDLGTGTGCLLLSVLSEYPAAWGLGLDLSPGAASLAARNARALGMADRTACVVADWAAPITGHFDVVLSNPPYIQGDHIGGLMPEVARFEPRQALDGGPDGLDAYRALIECVPRLLAPGGLAVLELGAGQAADVVGLARCAGFSTALRTDLGGIERAVLLEKSVGNASPAH
jgi:release factor glutamine methyltransferase